MLNEILAVVILSAVVALGFGMVTFGQYLYRKGATLPGFVVALAGIGIMGIVLYGLANN